MLEKKNYVSPDVKMLMFESEHCLALSNMEQVGDEKSEIDW
jgi:hypothetical protein